MNDIGNVDASSLEKWHQETMTQVKAECARARSRKGRSTKGPTIMYLWQTLAKKTE